MRTDSFKSNLNWKYASKALLTVSIICFSTYIFSQSAIQFAAISNPNKSYNDLRGLGEIHTEKVPNKNLYRYKLIPIGNFTETLRQIKNLGFKDAFISKIRDSNKSQTIKKEKYNSYEFCTNGRQYSNGINICIDIPYSLVASNPVTSNTTIIKNFNDPNHFNTSLQLRCVKLEEYFDSSQNSIYDLSINDSETLMDGYKKHKIIKSEIIEVNGLDGIHVIFDYISSHKIKLRGHHYIICNGYELYNLLGFVGCDKYDCNSLEIDSYNFDKIVKDVVHSIRKN